MTTTTATTFAVVLPVAHNLADHWVQTSHQAAAKGEPGWTGRLACAAHVATYTATAAVAVGLAWVVFALPITPAGFVAGQLLSAVTHYVADRRAPLAALAAWLGIGEFWRFGAPRPGRDDNPSLGTGAYALDQSWHHTWLLVAAGATALTGGGAT